MIAQHILHFGPLPRGFHLITREVLAGIPSLPESGLLNLFIQHTSAGLMINENADPDVLHDMELYFERLAPEDLQGIRHTMEGPDDMPAHVKSAITGVSLTIPIVERRLHLGTWQGIYLCEFRNRATRRTVLATLYS